MPQLAVILPAAGSSTRFGGTTSKLYAPLAGRAVLLRSFDAFLDRSDVAMIVIPTRLNADAQIDAPDEIQGSLRHAKVRLCAGGACRAQSVRNALAVIPPSIEWVAVHDAARPLVSQELIDRVLAAAMEHGAAVPALPVHLTIKQALGPLPAKVQRTLPRDQLWAMQTPQIMRQSALLEAFDRCPMSLDQITDDVQLLELAGHDVWLVAGEERNLKITTKADIHLAEFLLQHRP
jgi:2-C-methyl-D-erythritol 4-phosphate cytidylyltransferase